MIYTVTFNPAIDYVLHLTAPLAVGEINRTSDEACQFGGKGINVSGVLRELGCESIALGFTAGETGAWLERGLQLSGLKTRFIRLPDGMTRINVKVKGAKETEINGSGPNITPEAMQALWDNLEELGEGDILVLAGSIPSSMPQDVYQQILARLDGRGIRFVVDATRDLLVKVLPYHPFLIKPNNHELGEIFGKELNRDEEITQAARKLQQRGARNVLVSMAGDGALLLDETGAVHRIGTPKGKVVNSVGAGDSMVAGFVAGYLRTGDYRYALRLGTACGSATAFSVGLATKEKINELLETTLKRLRPIARKRDIEVVLESLRPVTAEVDEVKMSQIFTNLVENAIKYNRENGSVTVSAIRKKNEVVLTVSDTGNGIDEAFREQIFEPFFRVDKSRSRELGGVGLGLAMVREVVRVHDGTIEVYTNKHSGTTFEVKMGIGADFEKAV